MPLFSALRPALRHVKRKLTSLRCRRIPSPRRDDFLAESTDMVDLEQRLHRLDRLATVDAHIRLSFLRHRH